jgi:hypothetical protein
VYFYWRVAKIIFLFWRPAGVPGRHLHSSGVPEFWQQVRNRNVWIFAKNFFRADLSFKLSRES